MFTIFTKLIKAFFEYLAELRDLDREAPIPEDD